MCSSDLVKNYMDCQPNNKFKQGVEPNKLMRERINKLPVFLHKGDKPVIDSNGEAVIHIQDKKNFSGSMQESKKNFYGIVKKHPGLLSDIEKSKADMYVTTAPIFGDEPNTMGYATYDTGTGRDTVILRLRKNQAQPRTKASVGARRAFHELRHVQQRHEIGPQQYQRGIDLDKGKKWEERKDEKDAERYAWRKYSELKNSEIGKKFAEDVAKFQLYEMTEQELKNKYGKQPGKVIQEEHRRSGEEGFRQMYEDKDKDGIIAAADNDDNNPNNPSGMHYGEKQYGNYKPIIYTTRKEKILLLQQLGDVLGRKPTQLDLQGREHMPSYGAYVYAFGSWKNALKEAGFKEKKKEFKINKPVKNIPHWLLDKLSSEERYEAEQLLLQGQKISDVAKRYNVPMPQTGAKSRLYVSISPQEKIWYLQELARQTGQTPTSTQVDKLSEQYPEMPTSASFKSTFGSWNKALIAAGFVPINERNQSSIKEKYEYYGHIPSKKEISYKAIKDYNERKRKKEN